jgi:hypothetical protein
MHDVLKVIVGGNFIGPVEEVLVGGHDVRKSVGMLALHLFLLALSSYLCTSGLRMRIG